MVFDGYGSTASTKVVEQRRKALKCTSIDIIFHDNMPTTTTQAAFLANGNNKKRPIKTLLGKCCCLAYVSSMQKPTQTRSLFQQR